MLSVLHSVLGVVGGGGESSPLSVNSTFAELLRLVQVGIFAGVLYLIQGVKKTKESSAETHEDILDSVRRVQKQMDEFQQEINERLKGIENVR